MARLRSTWLRQFGARTAAQLVVLLHTIAACPSRDAQTSAGQRGLLRQLELASEETALLGDRLQLRLPIGTEKMPAPAGTAADIQLDDQRDHRAVVRGDERLEIRVNQIFATDGGNLREALRRGAKLLGLERRSDGDLVDVATRPDSGLRAIAVASGPGRAQGDSVALVFEVFVANQDHGIEHVGFWANPAATRDVDGCRDLARRVTATLRRGGRLLGEPTAARRLKVPGSHEAVVVSLPAGVVVAIEPGPDYAVYNLARLAPLGTDQGELNLWVGSFRAFETEVARIHDFRAAPGSWLDRPVTWRRWSRDGQLAAETRIEPQGGPGRGFKAHVLMRGNDGEMALWETIVRSMRLEDKPPPP